MVDLSPYRHMLSSMEAHPFDHFSDEALQKTAADIRREAEAGVSPDARKQGPYHLYLKNKWCHQPISSSEKSVGLPIVAFLPA